jgi:hypothetical protein
MPPSAWRNMAMISASLNRLFFIKSILEHLADKILLLKPLVHGEDYQTTISIPIHMDAAIWISGVTPGFFSSIESGTNRAHGAIAGLA